MQQVGVYSNLLRAQPRCPPYLDELTSSGRPGTSEKYQLSVFADYQNTWRQSANFNPSAAPSRFRNLRGDFHVASFVNCISVHDIRLWALSSLRAARAGG
jgi:hypothetical protein